MAMKWSDVAANSAFQALSLGEQEEARNQYFNEVVAPQVPQEEVDSVRSSFLSETRPSPVPESAPAAASSPAPVADAPGQPGIFSRAASGMASTAARLLPGTPIAAAGNAIAASLNPNVRRQQTSGSVMDNPAVLTQAREDLRQEGKIDPMLNPKFVEDFRAELAALPVENRMAALRQYAQNDQSVYGRAARVTLAQEEAANAKVSADNRTQASTLARAPAAPAALPAGQGGGGRAAFVDAAPNFMETFDGLTAVEKGKMEEVARTLASTQEASRRNPPDIQQIVEQERIDRFVADNPTLGWIRDKYAAETLKGVGVGLKAVTDAFGANNAASNVMQSAIDGVTARQSSQQKAAEQRRSAVMEEYADGGIIDQLKGAAKAFAVDPAGLMFNTLGIMGPTLLGGSLLAGTKAIQAVGARGASLIGKAGSLTAATTAGAAVTGGVMGAGFAKGGIFDAVFEMAKAEGHTNADATRIAQKSQSYTENPDLIALVAVATAAGAGTGVEPMILNMLGRESAKQLLKQGVIKSVGLSVVKEVPMEMFQGGSEAFSANKAAQRAGFNVEPMRGVWGNAFLEGMAAGGLAAGGGVAQSNLRLRGDTAQQAAARSLSDALSGGEIQIPGGADSIARNLLDPNNYNPALVNPVNTSRQLADVGPSAPVNFTPAGSPTQQAGMVDIVVPFAPIQPPNPEPLNVSTPGNPALGATTSSPSASDQFVGGLDVSGPAVNDAAGQRGGSAGAVGANVQTTGLVSNGAGQPLAGLTRPFERATDQNLLARTEASLAAPENNNAVVPVEQWFGRKGDGYVTQVDAQQALTGRQRMFPALSWQVEATPNGKFRLAGYANNQETSLGNTPPQNLQTQTAGAQTPAVGGIAAAQPAAAGVQTGDASLQADGVVAPAPPAAPIQITGQQFVATPALRQTAGVVTFAPGQMGAVNTTQRTLLSNDFTRQDMADGSAVFTRVAQETTDANQDSQEQPAIPQEQAATAAPAGQASALEGLGLPLSDVAFAELSGNSRPSGFRSLIQSQLDSLVANGTLPTVPQLGTPNVNAEASINVMANLFGAATGLGNRVVAYSEPGGDNGFSYREVAFVNTAMDASSVDAPRTTWHELRHVVEQIAKADTRAGLTNTPAQQFTAEMDTIFDDMTDAGKRAYVTNFLHKTELSAIADPAAREARTQELLSAPLLRSEMVADFLGNRSQDRAFLIDLAATDPQGFEGFVQKWLSVIDNLITSLRGGKTQGKKESALVDQYVRDLSKAKMVARDALIAFRKNNRSAQQPGVDIDTDTNADARNQAAPADADAATTADYTDRLLSDLSLAEESMAQLKGLNLYSRLGRLGLTRNDWNEIGVLPAFARGRNPASLADRVADGEFDEFLPYNLRHDVPTFDEQDATEFIKDALRQWTKGAVFYPYDVRISRDQLDMEVQSLQNELNQEYELDRINQEIREISELFADETRGDDVGQTGATGYSAGAEGRSTEGRSLEEEGAAEGLTAPTRADIEAQQDAAAAEPDARLREQIRKESEAGAGQFTLNQEDGRQDTTGDLDFSRKGSDSRSGSRGIGAVLQARINNNTEQVIAEYESLEGTDNGRLLDTDMVRELSPEYRADRSLSQEVHEAASSLTQLMFENRMQGNAPGLVVFMAGGGGAGKSTANVLLSDAISRAHTVVDGTLSSYDKARKNIQLALDRGNTVEIVYVYREPVEALRNGVLTRAARTGRTVSIDALVKSHVGASDAVRKLQQQFSGNARVKLHVVDNSQGAGNATLSSLQSITNVIKSGLKERLTNETEKLYQEGRIGEAVRRATTQSDVDARAETEVSASSAGVRQEAEASLQGRRGSVGASDTVVRSKRADLFPADFADKTTAISREVVVSSRGATETQQLGNVNSDGQQITATKQGLQNFWDWFGDSAVAESGQPLVLYHSTNADFRVFEAGRTTINSTTFGDVETQRQGIFLTPDSQFSQEYLRPGEGQNVMQVYASLQNPMDLRQGITGEDLTAIIAASDGTLNRRDFSGVDPYETWTFFDAEFGQSFVAAAKAAGFDGAVMLEAGPDGNKPATTYVAFESAQVKSASGNMGTFDADNADIRFSAKQTDTPAFKKWFGASKVVDAAGKPLVVFHGSPDARFVNEDGIFATLKDRMLKYGNTPESKRNADGSRAFFFTTSKSVAGSYANPKRAFDYQGAEEAVIETYVAIKNPLEFNADGAHWREAQKQISKDDFIKKAKDQGHDGVVIRNVRDSYDSMTKGRDPVSDVWVAFKSNQIKSATGNSGAFDPENPDIRLSRKQQKMIGSNFEVEATGFWSNIRVKLQDDALRMKRVTESVKRQGGIVGEAQNFYDANTLMSGRIQAANDDFRDNIVKPLTDKAAEYGIDMDELSVFAYAMHARERNAYIAGINKGMPDGGSGMTDAEAFSILQMVNITGDTAKFDELHQMLMAINATTRQVMLTEGLITQDEFNAMEGAYDHYVPLRGFENVDEETAVARKGVGRGINVRGAETVRALGRRSKAGDLIENVLSDYQRVIARVEKNDVGKVLLDFVLSNPDPDLWGVDIERSKPSFNKLTGTVQYTKLIEKGEDTVGVKVGGQQVYIKFADKELTRALRQAWKDETSGLERVTLAVSGHFNNWLRSVLTRYNPAFAMVNIPRDALWSGTSAALAELGPKGLAKYLAAYPQAIMAASRQEFGASGTTNPVFGNPVVDARFKEFRNAGGITGGFYMRSLEDISKDLRNDLLMAGAAPKNPWEAVKALPPFKLARLTLRVLEFIGSASENATRFALYQASREVGRSPAQSAILAKDGTTNFNRKGEWGGALNNLFLFFNAAVQGNAQLLWVLRSPAVKASMAGVAGIGVMLATYGAAAGGEDDDGEAYWDKIPSYIKERNLVIMLPPGDALSGGIDRVGKSGRYFLIPTQYGYNFFPNIGYAIADVLRNQADPKRGMPLTKAGMHLTSTFIGSVNPFGGAVDLNDGVQILLAMSPTIGDPLIQIINERNSFGRDSSPQTSPFDKRPDSERMFTSQRDTVAAKVAKSLNELGGGNEAKSGSFLGMDTSVTPGSIDTLISTTTGGLGVFIEQVASSLLAITDDNSDLKSSKIPFLNKFYGEVDEGANIWSASRRMREIRDLADSVKAQQKIGLDPTLTDNEQRLINLASMQETYQRMETQIRRREIEIIKDKDMTKPEKTLERKRLRVDRDKLATDMNREYLKEIPR
jgi:hypothetical protein